MPQKILLNETEFITDSQRVSVSSALADSPSVPRAVRALLGGMTAAAPRAANPFVYGRAHAHRCLHTCLDMGVAREPRRAEPYPTCYEPRAIRRTAARFTSHHSASASRLLRAANLLLRQRAQRRAPLRVGELTLELPMELRVQVAKLSRLRLVTD